MPIHKWMRVPDGIFHDHDFRHAWIGPTQRVLSAGVPPPDDDALAERFAGGFGPDVWTLQGTGGGNEPALPRRRPPAEQRSEIRLSGCRVWRRVALAPHFRLV
jgi:hypothetical protein